MKKSGMVVAIIAVAILVVGGVLIAVSQGNKGSEVKPTQNAVVTAEPTAKPELRNMCDIVLEPNVTEVTAGGELTINVMMKNIRNNVGIGAILAKLEYDKNVFAQVKQDNFTAGEGWDAPVYNSENEKEGRLFTMTETAENMTSDNSIYTIKMKVLDNVTAQNTNIKLTEISTSDGTLDIYNDDATITITIK